jgi:3-(3-hydroxy-phenyl)propionate hydroxylase
VRAEEDSVEIAKPERVWQFAGAITISDSPDAAEHLARMETRAAILRPDRYTLGVANTHEELMDLIAHIHQFLSVHL